VLGIALVLVLSAPAGAGVPPDPVANIRLGPLPPACASKPASAACEDGVVRKLDRARRALSLGPYKLPRNFTALAPARQLLILTNLDRLAYHLPPILGLLPALDVAAARGAEKRVDPTLRPDFFAGQPRWFFVSSWASNFPNALLAYYFWVYDDGFPGGNVDCKRAGDDGCWEHRRNVFAGGSPEMTLSMGAAVVRHADGSLGYGLLIAGWDPIMMPAYSYTWAQATADGANHPPSYRLVPPQTMIFAVARPASRAVRFRFRAIGRATLFECGLTRLTPGARASRPRFELCDSPATYRRLAPGRYRFLVRAIGLGGTDPTPARRELTLA
jgi:hypothetical protein